MPAILFGDGRIGRAKPTIQPIGNTLNGVGSVAVVDQIVVAVGEALSLLLLGGNRAHKASKSPLADSSRSDGVLVAGQDDHGDFHRTHRGACAGP